MVSIHVLHWRLLQDAEDTDGKISQESHSLGLDSTSVLRQVRSRGFNRLPSAFTSCGKPEYRSTECMGSVPLYDDRLSCHVSVTAAGRQPQHISSQPEWRHIRCTIRNIWPVPSVSKLIAISGHSYPIRTSGELKEDQAFGNYISPAADVNHKSEHSQSKRYFVQIMEASLTMIPS